MKKWKNNVYSCLIFFIFVVTYVNKSENKLDFTYAMLLFIGILGSMSLVCHM